METKNLSSATHKCVLVIDNAQPTGIVANIASVLSMTLGCKVNNIVSHDVYDKQGEKHLGITQLPDLWRCDRILFIYTRLSGEGI
jgi:hypothetical protein